jgi:hypothetical protein
VLLTPVLAALLRNSKDIVNSSSRLQAAACCGQRTKTGTRKWLNFDPSWIMDSVSYNAWRRIEHVSGCFSLQDTSVLAQLCCQLSINSPA